MKKLLYILSLSVTLIFSSCADRFNSFEDDNNKPILSFAFAGSDEYVSSLQTDVKISLKSNLNYSELVFRASDPDQDIAKLTYNFEVGEGAVFQNDVEVETIDFNQNLIVVRIFPSTVGIVRVKFTLSDQFENTDVVQIEMNTFLNQEPFAVLPSSFKHLNVEDEFEYEIDASGSFDQDGTLGGGVVNYRYTVDGNTFVKTDSKIPYIFSDRGTYIVKLSVQDSDGVWSEEVSETYNIN